MKRLLGLTYRVHDHQTHASKQGVQNELPAFLTEFMMGKFTWELPPSHQGEPR